MLPLVLTCGMMALMKRSKMILVIHYGMVCPGGAVRCQVHLQIMRFVNWIHFVRVLVFLSDFAMKNSVTETSSVAVMNSAIVTSSVTVALPMTDFVK